MDDAAPRGATALIGSYTFIWVVCWPWRLLHVECRAETERDGTRAETRFGFPAKRTSPFISAGVSVQSAAGSRGVRISGSNAG